MAATPVSICNQALSWLGGNLIISLDDNTDEAKICKANYEPLRDAVLEDREWTFAVKRASPSLLTEIPVYGFDNIFQIPVDVIRLLQVSAGTAELDASGASDSGINSSRGGVGIGREVRLPWVKEGDRILVQNYNKINIRYISRIEDTTKFSSAFVQCLAARIASDICLGITNNLKMNEMMAALYNSKLQNAYSSDGMQGRSYNTRSDSLTIIR